MFKQISFTFILALGLLSIGVSGSVVAAEEPMIVDANGDGAPDTVLISPNEDITPFLKVYGYTKDMNPIIKKVDGYAEDSKPIIKDEDDNLTPQCKH